MLDFERMRRELETAAPAPLHVRLRAAMNAQIADGTLRPGEALPSERTIHEELKINRATVRVSLRSLIDAGLIQSVPGTGNFVLERQESPAAYEKMVALIGSEPSFYIYYSQLASTFTHCLHTAGYRVDIATHNDDVNLLTETLDRWALQRVAAVAINASDRVDMVPVLDRIRASGIVVVIIGRKINYPQADFVCADNETIGYQAAHHLIHLGHTRIAYIGEASHSPGHDRAAGYIRAMQEAGLTPRLFRGPETGQASLPAWFTTFAETGDDPLTIWKAMANREITAAFCYNDGTAVWVQNQIRKINLNVPRDVSLVSIDNLPFFQFLDAPLTTFELPGEEVGREAAKLILRRLSGENFPPQQILLPARFIQRLSTAPPPALS
jgi:GntR family transcriptional regulator, arabinose operon transcriptional repressor